MSSCIAIDEIGHSGDLQLTDVKLDGRILECKSLEG